ncbi:SRSF protein kinase 2 [Dermatophagoides farinae]|uniref:non-specific serine/threonine protein kinase n=1 Tax=Dermatophagoides farinae TaxID=6954 RepID=A0A922HU39_DERFA|nr:SRSF protein kinase 2 [Dermatophagoides farinae]
MDEHNDETLYLNKFEKIIDQDEEDIELISYICRCYIEENIDENREQEDRIDYKLGGYHPLKIFDVLKGRYSAILKLGWGHFSTVWLCWDMKEKIFVAIKVVKSAVKYTETANDEIELLIRVRRADPDHNQEIVQMYDSFQIIGINGSHVCMVFEVLGCTLSDLIIKSQYNGIPLENVRSIIKQVLRGLHYLHHTCGIIHTDLKPQNVLLVGSHEMAQKLAFKALYRIHHNVPLPLSYKSNAPIAQFEAEYRRIEKKFRRKNKKKAKKLANIKSNTSSTTSSTVTNGSNVTNVVNASNVDDVQADNCDSNSIRKEDESICSRPNNNSSNQENLLMAEFAWVYDPSYIKYHEGVGYPEFAAEILESAPRFVRKEIQSGKNGEPAFEICDVCVKIGDLGNACWVNHHFSEVIQTRQYRSPEVILGAGYGPSADVWSLACLAFELATGDFLFYPRSTIDEDHITYMMELLGPLPREVIFAGSRRQKFFDNQGRFLKRSFEDYNIYSLLVNKHKFPKPVANIFADFLETLLNYNPIIRPTALECLKHPFMICDYNYSSRIEMAAACTASFNQSNDGGGNLSDSNAGRSPTIYSQEDNQASAAGSSSSSNSKKPICCLSTATTDNNNDHGDDDENNEEDIDDNDNCGVNHVHINPFNHNI